MKYNRLIITALAVVLMAACGNKDNQTSTKNPQASVPVVSVVTAVAEDVEVNNTFTSNIEPFATNNIVSQTAGRIVSINAEVGDKVRKGQLLAKMEDSYAVRQRLHRTGTPYRAL